MKVIHVYRLTDANGDKTFCVVDDPSDDGCIGGYDANGKYQQYDSYELYHAYGWAEKHGMKLECGVMEIDTDKIEFK